MKQRTDPWEIYARVVIGLGLFYVASVIGGCVWIWVR